MAACSCQYDTLFKRRFLLFLETLQEGGKQGQDGWWRARSGHLQREPTPWSFDATFNEAKPTCMDHRCGANAAELECSQSHGLRLATADGHATRLHLLADGMRQ